MGKPSMFKRLKVDGYGEDTHRGIRTYAAQIKRGVLYCRILILVKKCLPVLHLTADRCCRPIHRYIPSIHPIFAIPPP